ERFGHDADTLASAGIETAPDVQIAGRELGLRGLRSIRQRDCAAGHNQADGRWNSAVKVSHHGPKPNGSIDCGPARPADRSMPQPGSANSLGNRANWLVAASQTYSPRRSNPAKSKLAGSMMKGDQHLGRAERCDRRPSLIFVSYRDS